MSETTIIEINGVRLEVDMRHARRIEDIRIGSPVKLLAKGSYSGNKVYAGIVIGFEPFKDLPTILVAYIEDDYSTSKIKVVSINSANKEYDLVAAVDRDFTIDRDMVIKKFEREIATKQREIDTINDQIQYFRTNFKAFWAPVDPRAEPEVLAERPEPF